MNPRQIVSLRDVRFFAYHGFYPEEQLIGNEFFVDVSVSFDYDETEVSNQPENPVEAEDFRHTINYEILYRLVKEEMEIPRKLLETACYGIFDRIRLNFPFLDTVLVRIRKKNPLFGGDTATAEIEIDWSAGNN